MRRPLKLILLISGTLILVGGVLLFSGGFSTPRDFASPHAKILILDPSGAPMSDVDVERHWYDFDDGNKYGSDRIVTGQTGIAEFERVPAKINLFTGVLRKAITNLGPCGSSSGAETSITITFTGGYNVVPKGKVLHPRYSMQEDQDGIIFDTTFNSGTNTCVSLTFPKKTTIIDYVLISTPKS